MAHPEQMTFTRQPDGGITVERFPEVISLSQEFLNAVAGLPEFRRLPNQKILFRMANGSAIYQWFQDGLTDDTAVYIRQSMTMKA